MGTQLFEYSEFGKAISAHALNSIQYSAVPQHMTANEIEEITLDDSLYDEDYQRFIAECNDCGTPDQFTTPGKIALRDSFEHHCFSCNSWREDIGDTHRFRVTRINPDADAQPSKADRPPRFPSNDSN